ncbi:hypothetical protein F2Q70_00040584 [Brassica cretica]|uniref:Uncharacterized protein n=1 Tax=Brassica cretica TaxID=69181 RepID=A0A8S9K8T4_BRACR|nr:hypothetical protein F2Q70_00040584 [Brassica cretica]
MDILSVFGQKFVRNFRRISLPSEWPSEWSVFSCSELRCHLITDLKFLAGTPPKLHWNTLEQKPAKENHRELSRRSKAHHHNAIAFVFEIPTFK